MNYRNVTKFSASNFTLALSLAALLTACGSEQQTTPATTGPTTTTPPPVTDTAAPTATILYPWVNSRTDTELISVEGIANDDSKIEEVKVNGIQATLTLVQGKKQVSWQAKVPKAGRLVVETRDVHGNINTEASTAKVISGVPPLTFTIDDENKRIIGHDFELNKRRIIDLVTNEQKTLSLDDGLSFITRDAFSVKENRLFRAALVNNKLNLSSSDLDSGLSSIVHIEPLPALDDNSHFYSIPVIEVSESENALYILINRDMRDLGTRSQIVKFDLSSRALTTVIDGQTQSGKSIITRIMTPTEKGLLIVNQTYRGNYQYHNEGLFNLALDGSDMSQVPYSGQRLPELMTVDKGNNFAYLTGYDGIHRYNISTGELTALPADPGKGALRFGQLRVSDINPLNDALLVSDSDLEMIISVDPQSGKRSKFMHNGIGEGRTIVYPFNFTIDNKNNIAYLADDGGNGEEVIIAVDLNTGNRRAVGDINSEQNLFLKGIMADPDSNALYVIIEGKIVKIDLATERSEELSSNEAGTGPTIGVLSGAVLDRGNNRILVTEPTKHAVMAVDLATGNRSVLSSEKFGIGSGPSLGSASDIAIDTQNNIAYVSSTGPDQLYTVNLATGERNLALDTCLDSQGNNLLNKESGNFHNIFFDESSRELLMTAQKLLVYNPDNKFCKVTNISEALDIAKTSNNQILATAQSRLLQLNLATDESVVISK